MPLNLQTAQAKSAAYWKAYFAKFRRRECDGRPAPTQSGYGYSAAVTALPFPDRRRAHPNRFIFLR
jgi:hypothetical protein